MAFPVTDLGFSTGKKKKPPPPGWSQEDVEAAFGPVDQFGVPISAGYSGFGASGGSEFAPRGNGPELTFSPSIKIPGYDPDYAALLAGDPTVVAAQGDLGAFQGQLGDARRAAIRRAVISAGLAPSGALADVDASTIEAAEQNRFSSVAELNRQRGRAGGDLGAALAGRGITFSGGQGAGGERIQEGYERGTTQLTQALLDQIAGYESGYVEKLGQVRAQYNALKEQAALRIQQDPRYQPIGENDAILDPTSGLYMTPDGRWYNAQGKRVAPPGPAAPAAPTAPPPAAPPPAAKSPTFFDFDNRLARQAAAAGRNYF